jgi:hypothetical protein
MSPSSCDVLQLLPNADTETKCAFWHHVTVCGHRVAQCTRAAAGQTDRQSGGGNCVCHLLYNNLPCVLPAEVNRGFLMILIKKRVNQSIFVTESRCVVRTELLNTADQLQVPKGSRSLLRLPCLSFSRALQTQDTVCLACMGETRNTRREHTT